METSKNNFSFLKTNWKSFILFISVVILFAFTIYNFSQINEQLQIIKKQQNPRILGLKNDVDWKFQTDRYRIYFSPHLQKSTFLVDNKKGLVYSLYIGTKTKEYWWKKTYIEGNFNSIPTK